MERASARVVKVKESRERERRDMCSSMAARGPAEEQGRAQRSNGTEGVTVVTDGAKGAGQMLLGGFKTRSARFKAQINVT